MSIVKLSGLQKMIEEISTSHNLPKTAVQQALRKALLKGYERYRRTQNLTHFEEDHFENFEVDLDLEEECFRVLATKTIVDEVTDEDHQIPLADVQEVASEAQLGEEVVIDVTPDQNEFGRMAAIQTKQVLAQELRDQQRQLIQEEFQELEEEVVQARVLRFDRKSIIMAVRSSFDKPEVEADLPQKEQLPNDTYRVGSTFKVLLKKVCEGPHRGPQLVVSRTASGLVVYLFENEVPEIQEDIVRIVAIAREANPPSRYVGARTKIAVDTTERDVDPVGACIGARGSRIQVVVNELRGEKIDVIRWSPDPSTYIANALSPAKVDEVILVNPEGRQAHVLVSDNQLSLAIGKEGQNVRLAARLTGWKIDIKDTNKYDHQAEQERILAQVTQEQQTALAKTNISSSWDEEDEEALEENSDQPKLVVIDKTDKVVTDAPVTALSEEDLPEEDSPEEDSLEEDSLEEDSLEEDLPQEDESEEDESEEDESEEDESEEDESEEDESEEDESEEDESEED